MSDLINKKCVPHEKMAALKQEEIKEYLSQLKDWEFLPARRSFSEGGETNLPMPKASEGQSKITKEYKLKDFKDAMEFINKFMIYLIGGPPKCGKTTLSKKLSKKLGIPWISADTLQTIAKEYTNKKDISKKFPWSTIRKIKKSNDIAFGEYTSKEIVKLYTTQAKVTYGAIDMVSICEITDGNDYIIEGYQVEPQLVSALYKKYGE